MSKPRFSRHKATLEAFGFFVGSFIICYYLRWLWPGIILVIGGTMLLRQCLRGRYYDGVITTVTFALLFVLYSWMPAWAVFLPTLLSVAAIYLIYREVFVRKPRVGSDVTEYVERELEDEQDEK